jgi:glyoxylase-like metal-dependent hydrolase (beta-lactamase superfamily II)
LLVSDISVLTVLTVLLQRSLRITQHIVRTALELFKTFLVLELYHSFTFLIELLVKLLAEHAPKVELIVTTHQHGDHWQALEAVAEATGAPTAVHQLDADALPVKPDRFLAGGDTIVIGELNFDVIHLRGHTPGSVALALRPAGDRTAVQLFTGDCLFPGGVGKTWEPGAFEELLGDVSSQLFGVFDDDTVVYPGHGDDTTLGAERPHLEEWRERGW